MKISIGAPLGARAPNTNEGTGQALDELDAAVDDLHHFICMLEESDTPNCERIQQLRAELVVIGQAHDRLRGLMPR